MATISLLKNRTANLLKVSSPLMISFLSMLGMVFADRIFLANYSIDALSAAVSAGTLAFSITFGIQTLTLIASVFVAQFNGAKKYSKLGAPVWQMVWLSVATVIVVIPCAFLVKHILFLNSPIATKQILVFKCIMFLTPLFALTGALQSFYNGQEKTIVITYLSITVNAINIILDPIFIFGYKNIIPSMGIIGAHLATATGLIVEIIILLILFLAPNNRKNYGTNQWHLDIKLIKDCIKIGSPEAIAVGIEILCWGLFYNIMALLGQTHLIVASISQSIVLLFFFFGLGLEQGASIIAGNLIGANRKNEVHEILYAGCVLISISTCSVLTLFIIWPDFIINWFCYHNHHMEDMVSNTNNATLIETSLAIVRQNLPFIALYQGCEAIRWTINGLLRAAGDTFFLLLAGIINIILFLIIPTYLLMVVYKMPIQVFFNIWIFFAFIASVISYIRFHKGSWKNIVLLK